MFLAIVPFCYGIYAITESSNLADIFQDKTHTLLIKRRQTSKTKNEANCDLFYTRTQLKLLNYKQNVIWIFLSARLCQITEQAIWKQNGMFK